MKILPLSSFTSTDDLKKKGYSEQHTLSTKCDRKTITTYLNDRDEWQIVVAWKGVIVFIMEASLNQMRAYIRAQPKAQELRLISMGSRL